MGAPQGNDLQDLTHLVDTLKRVVLFDNHIDIATGVAQPTMATAVLLDLSSQVSATAEAGIFSLFTMPVATAYWRLVTSATIGIFAETHIQAYAGAINQFRSNYGIQTLTSNKGVYYQHQKLAGGGNGSFILKLHGYIEPA